MALCVYHETTEAVAVCTGCKQDICQKCREFGANGMCGMCLEMHNARNATLEASKAARMEANAAPTGARRPPGPRPAPAGAPPPKAPPRPARPPAPPGMCQEHPDQKLAAHCAHCKKKVCPYCLDLYDHCAACRSLPACVRHESMVAKDRCAACKMHFCSVCLDNGDRCDRCRTLGLTAEGAEGKPAAKPPTQKLKPPAKGTSKLPAPPPGAQAPQREGAPPRPTPRPAARSTASSRPIGRAKKQKEGLPPVAIFGGLGALVLVIGMMALGGKKSTFSPEEAARYLQQDMHYVQQAALAIKKDKGAYPDSVDQIMDQVTRQGVDASKLPLPIKLAVNAQPDEPLEISYRLVGTGFEVRALDQDGRPFAIDGRDVILTHQAGR